ncbi:rhodanese-like domain-containing protein [Kitasatospora sp. MMS16-BH015]|uniref:rhodanese-like domain-containing protein n=1 Tax=Kitasatospora sp. MMS16-BH015 TaxID=2018025 RepID=UPI001C2C5067|nr:rhodanese-like domain-containing protein [Kitasatospora sp. MMS16-BH015]
MSAETPAPWTDPERQQLEELVAATELAWLTLDVEVETLRVEIDNFALVHHELLGPLYARLDELDALIAEAVAAASGDPEDLRRAEEARRLVADQPELDALRDAVAAAEAEAAAEPAEPPTAGRRVRPDREAQRVYRELARRAHPDLSTDPAEQERRSAFIARVNEAYAAGDSGRLTELAEEWRTAPESAPDLGSPDRLGWLRDRLEWLRGRIGALATEQVRLERTPMGELLQLAPQEPERLLEELAEQLLARAADRRAELERVLGELEQRMTGGSSYGAAGADGPGGGGPYAGQTGVGAADAGDHGARGAGGDAYGAPTAAGVPGGVAGQETAGAYGAPTAGQAAGQGVGQGVGRDAAEGYDNGGADHHRTQESSTMFTQLPSTDAASVPDDALLLDVREQDEWDAGHVDGALHIPIGEVVERLGELPDGKLYVVCRVGGRSAQVVQYLVAQGREAVNVDGGMFAWEGAGRPMVSSDGRDAFVL